MFDILERHQLFVFILNIYMLFIHLALNNVERYVFADKCVCVCVFVCVCVDILGRVNEVGSNEQCRSRLLKGVRSLRKAYWYM